MAYCLINKSNYFNNLSKIEEKIDKDKIAVVVKNNAYGHGLVEISKLAKEYGVKHAVVINLDEAQQIFSLFETVLVLQDIPQKEVSNNVIITINSLDAIKQIPSYTKVELKIDTGMHRNGILINDIGLALDMILESNLILHGVFTHFSSAYKENASLLNQKEKFDQLRSDIKNDNRFPVNIRFHCCASSSLYRIENFDYDLARIGIMSYGYISLPDSYKKPKLKPVLSLWGEKITSKTISKGDSIGYGQSYIADGNITISTYDIGYGDGFLRLDENKKSTIQDGREILGIVSMNSFSILGDDKEVCIFENAEYFSDVHGTIVYEIISNINQNFKRKVI